MPTPSESSQAKVAPRPFQQGEKGGLCLLLLALFAWTLAPLAGFDFWFYLAVGRDIAEQGRIPWSDSYLGSTATMALGRYGDQAWLGNLAVYAAWAVAGPLGLVLLKSGLLCATTLLVYLSSRRLGLSPFWAGTWASLGLWTIRGRFEMRTYLFSDLALAALVLILVLHEQAGGDKRWRRTALALALLFAVWTNLHQGIIAGYAVLGCWLLFGGPTWKERLGLSALAGACSLVRPHALSFPGFLYDHFSNSTAIQGVIEWAAPDLQTFLTQLAPFFLVLIVLLPWGLMRPQERTSPPLAFGLLVLLFAVLGLRSLRAVSELLPVVCPLAVAYFPSLPEGRRMKGAAVLLLGALMLATWRPAAPTSLARITGYPGELVAAIPPGSGQIFNSFEFGNYLVYLRVAPFLHGMTAFYKEQLITEFEDVLNPTPQRWELLKRYDVGSALLHHPTEVDATLNLVQTLFASADWRLELWDDTGLLFLKGKAESGLEQVRPWESPPWTDAAAAEAELTRLVERRPSAMAYLFLSKLQLERGDLTGATANANRAVKISPGFYPAWSQLGLCYAKSNNLDGVLSASKGGLEAYPGQASSRFNRALALLELSRQEGGLSAIWHRWQARYQARRALWIDPAFAPAQQILDQS